MSTSDPFKDRAAETGLTEPLVRDVIASFYEQVRQDPILGPVFFGVLGDDWTAHLNRINLFWLAVTRLGQGYPAKNFMPAHIRHPSIQPDQLPRWLELFRKTARSMCPPEAADVLIDIAERMAESIKIGLERRG
jgi:hemoglobin